MSKRRWLAAGILSVLLALCVGLAAGNAAAAAAAGSWSGDTWQTSEEDGVITYTMSDAGRLTYDGTVDFNYLEADVKMSDALLTSQFLFALHTGNDTSTNAYFRYYPEPTWQSVRIYYGVWDNMGDDYEYNTGADGLIFTDTWRKFVFVFENDYLAMYVDGELIAKATGDYSATDFTKVTPLFYAWGVNVQIRNIVTKTVVPEDLEHASQADNWEPNAEVQTTGEGEDALYTVSSNATGVVEYRAGSHYLDVVSDYDTMQADFKYSGSAESNMEYVGIQLNSGNDYYLFTVWPNTAAPGSPPVAFVQKNTEDPISRWVRVELDPAEFGKDTWFTMKVTLCNNYFSFLLNGETIATAQTAGQDVGNISWTRALAVMKGTPAQIKNLVLSSEMPEYVAHFDLEFSDPGAVAAMTAENATLTWEEGAMKAALSGENATIVSPEIDVARGSKYSVLLSVRNTFVVRMKNETSAEELTISFVTDKDGEYDARKQKTFAIEPNSDWRTYYFNLSDVIDCDHWKTTERLKRCDCFLRGFKLTLEGAPEGNLYFDEISFAREDRLETFAAQELSATADKEAGTVTVTGTLLPEYADQTVTIVQTEVTNYNQLTDWKGNMKVASATADGTSFTVTFPLARSDMPNMTHLSTKFLATVGDGTDFTKEVKLGRVFMIENWRDFSENPYAFTLPDLTVKVTDVEFGAKGDGFTNDTAAIQAAIDYVSGEGGGTVIVPGETSTYGRRYIMTGITLKSNVELRIEEGAVLWQSHHLEDYTAYKVYMGHVDMGANVPWGLSALMHLPFIYIYNAENVRVTGGGTIRMDDTGTEWLDGNGYAWDSNITAGCSNIVHMIPLAIYRSNKVEVSDINIRRCSNWHVYIREASEIYLGNVDMAEVNDINGDGFDFSNATYNIVIDRCSLYSNDDAIVISTSVSDPRDDASLWRKPTPSGIDFSTHNFTIRRCNMFGGHGLTFIPWSSDAQDAYKVRIYDIDVRDCVLGGTSNAVGAWADNPFYGTSNYIDGTYGSTDAVEDGDYSPVQDVVIVDNEYTAGCSFYGINVTNAFTDFGMVASPDFENGDFDKEIHKGEGVYHDESTFVTGLSYWSGEGDIGTEKIGTKQSVAVDTGETLTQDNYAGYVKGNGELYQGLYKTFGAYRFSLNVKLVSGTAVMFVRNARTGEAIVEKTLSITDDFEVQELSFRLEAGMLIQLGIRHEGGAEEIVYLDDATLTTDASAGIYDVEGEEIVQDFDDGEYDFTVKPGTAGITAEDGVLVTAATSEYKLLLNNGGALDTFEVSVDILNADGMVNAGLYLFAGNAGAGQDDIAAYNVQVEKALDAGSYTVSLFLFENAYIGSLAKSGSILLEGDIIHLRVVVKANTIFVFTDGGEEPVLTYEVPAGTSGNVGLRSQMAETTFDNFRLKTEQYVQSGGDKSALFELIRQSNRFSEYGYTAETYAAFREAVEAARALPDDAKQSEIDDCYERLERAMGSLRPRDVTAEERQALEDLVAVAEKFVPDDYTAESYGELIQALTAAQAALESGADYVSAKTALQAAIEELETQPTANVGETPDQGGSGWVLPVVLCLAGLAVGAGGALGISALMRRKKK